MQNLSSPPTNKKGGFGQRNIVLFILSFISGSMILGLLFSFSFDLCAKSAKTFDVIINEIAWHPKVAYADNGPKTETIIINEIAWMGNQVSYTNEWIELYNTTHLPINLEGWTLKAIDGTPEIQLTGTIEANDFYLLERTDDNTIPNISANQIYSGALENEGEKLELYDNYGDLIDSIDRSSGWLAGDNETKQTMERISLENWQNSQKPDGTPKAKNSE